MKILAHIHTYNAEDAIDRSLTTLLSQTARPQAALLVDNGSTDKTLDRLFPPDVTVIRNSKNIGATGAVKTGLEYALVNNYEWLWVLDADSLPRRDALEQLIRLYESFDDNVRKSIGILSCSHLLVPSKKVFYGRRLTRMGSFPPQMNPGLGYHECDVALWSGSLINLEAVRHAGLPRGGKEGIWEDLAMDFGDTEFYTRIRQAGYKVIVHRGSLIEQRVGKAKLIRVFGMELLTTNHSPLRRYLFFRGLVYFWIHVYPSKNLAGSLLYIAYTFSIKACGILVGETSRAAKIKACFHGVRDGLCKNLYRRYP